jgi:hypothetical protein
MPNHEGLYVKGRTPGKWMVHPISDGIRVDRSARWEVRRDPTGNEFPNVSICTVYETSVMKNEPMHLEADALLIAAAPEMLEALRAMVAAHQNRVSTDGEKWVMQQARAAIAKAEGR